MEHVEELLLFRVAQHFKPFLLMLMDDWTKGARGLSPRFTDFGQNHAPVRGVGHSTYVRAALERVEQTRDRRSTDDEPIGDYIGR
jgi:hypothetical protein